VVTGPISRTRPNALVHDVRRNLSAYLRISDVLRIGVERHAKKGYFTAIEKQQNQNILRVGGWNIRALPQIKDTGTYAIWHRKR